MKPHHLKPVIKSQIVTFFDQFRSGDTLRTDDVVKFVKRHMGLKYIYPDTVLRHLRELRQHGKLNYTVINKRDRIIKVIAAGEVHSR